MERPVSSTQIFRVVLPVVLFKGAKSRLQERIVGRGTTDKGRGRGRWKGKMAGGGQNDVSVGRNAGSGGVAADLMDSGGIGVALPCASAKRSRLLPEVVDDCSYGGSQTVSTP